MKLLNSKGIASTTVIIVAIIVIIAAVAGVYLVVMKPTTAAPAFKIAVVSDIGGRGDLSFNDMAFKGGEEAERDFNVQMVELISQTESDYLPNLRTAASDPDVKLIVGVGFLLTQIS